jgi:hypothetical protein
MPLREFTDKTGRLWQAWSTIPGNPHEAAMFATNARVLAQSEGRDVRDTRTPASGHVSPGYEKGWLTFQAGEDKRRLSPIPTDWATATDAELAGYLARAKPVHLSDAAARLLGRPNRTREE